MRPLRRSRAGASRSYLRTEPVVSGRVGGNNQRLIAFIEFKDNRMYVKHIVNHTEYIKLSRRYAKR